jgi:hypothetical protein
MSKGAIHPQMGTILDLIDTIEQHDAHPRAHTRTRNALATDADRIEAARAEALWLSYSLNLRPGNGQWVHYADSVGGIFSEQA